jgi:DNA repair photolyase
LGIKFITNKHHVYYLGDFNDNYTEDEVLSEFDQKVVAFAGGFIPYEQRKEEDFIASLNNEKKENEGEEVEDPREKEKEDDYLCSISAEEKEKYLKEKEEKRIQKEKDTIESRREKERLAKEVSKIELGYFYFYWVGVNTK